MSIISAIRRYSKQKVLSSFLLGFLSLAVVALSIFSPCDAYSAQETLTWTAPTTNVDGTPLTDLAGYKVYYGTASANYSQTIDVGNVTTSAVSSLNDGLTYFFAVTAYDSSGIESAYSNEVSKTTPSAQQYSLAITKSGTGSGTVTSSSGGISCGTVCTATYNPGSVVTLTTTPAGNSTFSSWSGGGCTGSGTCSLSINANTTVTANFAVKTYTITASAGAGGTISPSGTVTANYGVNQAFTITPNTGYHVVAVTVDGTSVGAVTAYTFNNVTANHTISATFAVNAYTITASAGAGGTISPSGVVTANYGANQAFAITANTGYQVVAVTVDGTSVGAVTAYTFSNVTANHTISASFTANAGNVYIITATAGGGGAMAPSGSVSVNQGANQTFTITPSTGYSVSDVKVDGTSVGIVSTYTFNNVTVNHTIAATFTLNSYTITASAGTGGGISPTGAVTANYGANQAFTITANAGYSVSDVKVDGASVGAVTAYTFTNVTANHTIVVTFISSGVITEEWGNASTSNHLNTVEDTYINIDGDNYSTDTQLNVYTWPANSIANAILIKWDLSSIPSGSTIVSATLSLYLEGYDGTGEQTLYNVPVSGVINKNPIISQATGYTYDGSNPWSPSTGVYNNIPLAQGDISQPEDIEAVDTTLGYKSWNVTQIVQGWVNNDTANYGMLLNSDNSAPSDSNRYFSSSENTNAGQRPKLVISYIPPMDSDGDGIPDIEEWGPQGNDQNYDGNNDGIPDYLQNSVASFHTFGNIGYITLFSPDGHALSNVKAEQLPQGAPMAADLPYQFVSFKVNNVAAGSSTTIVIKLPEGISINNYYKYGPTPDNPAPHWYSFMFDGQTGAEISGNIITLHFVDGLRGDDDLTANGQIADQGGPAITPVIGAGPSPLVFGTISVNTTSSAQVVTVSNTGLVPLAMSTVTITGSDAGDFVIVGDTCSSQNVAPAGICTISVAFAPHTVANKSAFLTISSDDPATPVLTIPLSGTVFALQTYTITANSCSNGTISPPGTITVNQGTTQTYAITPNTGYKVSDVQVDGASVGAVTVYPFNNVTANHTISATFAINNTPLISVSPISYTFGNTKVSRSSYNSFKIKNVGKANLSILKVQISGSDASMFSASSINAKTLRPSSYFYLQVKFKPTSKGVKNAVLSITSNDPNTPVLSIPLSGTGI